MGDGPKRSPLHKKGPRMGYSTMDRGRSPSLPKEEIFMPSNPEPELTTIDRVRRYDAVNIDTCRAPVYVPCNIPRWCPVPRTFFDHRQNYSQHYDAYDGRQNTESFVQGLEYDIANRSSHQAAVFNPNVIPAGPNVVPVKPCHYVDLEISSNREPVVHRGIHHLQPAGRLPRETPCEYAQLDFDASAQSHDPHYSVDYSASQWLPDIDTVDSEFADRQPSEFVGYESVGCQADLDDGFQQNSHDFAPSEDAAPWTYASPYSDIPVYRQAYDQFRSASSSPYRSASSSPYRIVPESSDPIELLKPCQVKEEQSPRRQKGKKHRVSFKVSQILS